MKIWGLLVGAVMLFGAQSASAVTIVNGSFELGTPADAGGFTNVPNGSTAITGWTVGGDSVDWIGSLWQASEGGRSLDLSGNNVGSVSQDLIGLTIGQEYTITFDMAGNPGGAPTTKSMFLSVSASPGGQGLFTFNTTGASFSNMGWVTQTFVFIATASTQTLTFLSGDATAFGPALDNVTIAATPIPGALLLFGSALGGMGFLGYRRKKQAAAAEA